MLPWGHTAVGYLLYSLYSRSQLNHPPIGLTVYALAVGTQFPDLIDKPLTWTIPLLPYGRSLAHSVFTMTLLLGALWLAFNHSDQRELIAAFAVGYASHLIADGIGPALNGDYLGLGYLFWPLTSVREEGTRSFVSFFLNLEPTPLMIMGMVLTILALLLWIYDGMPGVKDLFEMRALEKRKVISDED